MSIWADLTTGFANLPIENVARGAGNPRKEQNPERLQELQASIQRFGILQPLIVRKVRSISPMFEVVAGGRRYVAAKAAGVRLLPCIVVGIQRERTALEVALTENLHREDLSPIDTARAVKALMEMGSYTQAQVGERLKKSQPEISRLLALLKLPEDVQEQVRCGVIPKSHAEELLPLCREPEKVRELAAVASGSTLREVNQRVSGCRPAPRVSEPLVAPARPTVLASAPTLPRPTPETPRQVRPRVELKIIASGGRRRETLHFPDEAALDTALSKLRGFAL